MAVPKRKMSRSNTRTRRSQWKASAVATVECSRCKSPRRPHQACPSCGAYNNRSYAEALRTEHDTN